MAEGEDSDSAAVRLLPLQLQQPATLTLPLFQAAIEALDKRTRECGWAQRFCAAMAALQVPAPLPFSRPAAHSPQRLKQEANQAHDGSAATAASREAQQLLQAVQADESFTMQVLTPPPSPSRTHAPVMLYFRLSQSNLRSWTLELEAHAAALQ